MECASNLQGDDASACGRVRGECFDGGDGACGYNLAAAIGVCCDEACCVDGFADVFFNAAEYCSHAGRGGGCRLRHAVGAHAHETHCVFVTEYAREGCCGDFTDGVTREDELFTVEFAQCEATGDDACSHDEGLGDCGVFDGFFFGFGAVVNQVDACRFGESFQVLTHTFNLEPGAQEALLLGALSGANECAHAVRPFWFLVLVRGAIIETETTVSLLPMLPCSAALYKHRSAEIRGALRAETVVEQCIA